MRRVLLALAVVVAWAVPAWAAVAYDNSTVAAIQFSVNTITTPAFTISGTNRAAILCLWITPNTATNFIASIGGVSATAIANADTGAAQAIRIVCFGTTTTPPPTGSQTATVQWDNIGGNNAVLGALTATGVDQTTPLTNGNANTTVFGANVAVTITSTSGDLTTTAVGIVTGGSPLVTNQTGPKWDSGDVSAGDVGPGTGTTTHTWTRNGNDTYAVAGANFLAASGATPTPSIPQRLLLGIGT